MARSSAYLEISRHHVFYFRIRVPKELIQYFPSAFIRRSLKTRCRREAIIRSSVLLEQVFTLFTVASQGQRVQLSSLTWVRPAMSEALPEGTSKPRARKGRAAAGPKVSAVLRDYLKEQKFDGVSEKTLADKCSVVELLIRIIGDKSIKQVSRADARMFKETALRLPPRIAQLPSQSLEKAIENADETISPTTFNNYVKNLSTLFNYAVREGYCDRNPIEGLKVKQQVKANAQRSRFTLDDLKRLFTALGSERQQEQKPYRKWLPLLGLYTGARMNELCQLYLDDIVTVNGIDCIHVRATRPDQSLKNLTSERLIPIHSQLKASGFLDFLQCQKALGHERLFPELTLHKRHGYTHSTSRWFAGVRDKVGMKQPGEKKDFHSFRHTVADHLKQLGVAESLIGGILGHQTGGITFGRYGKDYAPDKLLPVIELVDFEV